MSERKSTSIQFGPLWLRNMAQAQSDKQTSSHNNGAGTSRSGQEASASSETRGPGQAMASAEAGAPGSTATSGGSTGTATSTQTTMLDIGGKKIRTLHAQTLTRLQASAQRPAGQEASASTEPRRSSQAAAAEAGTAGAASTSRTSTSTTTSSQNFTTRKLPLPHAQIARIRIANRRLTQEAAPAEARGPGQATASAEAGASASTSGASTGSQNASSDRGARPSQAPPLARLQLASHRYGREEMLALCDKSLEAPTELKQFNLLYHPREKHPLALNAFPSDESRGAIPRTTPTTETARAPRASRQYDPPPEPRARGRPAAFQRNQLPTQSGFPPLSSGNGARASGFNAAPEEEPVPARPWSASNGGAQASRPGEPAEWAQSKLFRRRSNHTMSNWRQTSREDGDEWSRPAPGIARGRAVLDKWADREWGEPERRRSQPWSAIRRTWVSGDTSDDKLPEWAMDSVESGAGSFDSTGAFHGYSHDDSNIQTNQEPASNFALTRSHTHGSFSRSNAPDDGSDEWWTSDKAKKLSPKRYNALERKPKRVTFDMKKSETELSAMDPQPSTSAAAQQRDEEHEDDSLEAIDSDSAPNTPEDTQKREKFSEGDAYGGHSDMGYESNEERGFQSVMINATNDLRQRHQNMVTSTPEHEPHARRSSESLFQLIKDLPTTGNELDESAILDGLLDMTLNDSDIPKILAVTTNPPPTPASPVATVRPMHVPNLAVPPPNMSVPLSADMSLPPPQNMSVAPLQNMSLPPPQNMSLPPTNMSMPPPNMQLPPPPNMSMPLPNLHVPPPNMLPPPNMSLRISSAGINAQSAMNNPLMPGITPGLSPGMTIGVTPGMSVGPVLSRQASGVQSIGVQNQALNTALGLAVGGHNASLMQNQHRNAMQAAMHTRHAMAGYQPDIQNTVQPMSAGQPTNSLFTDHANLPTFMPAHNSHAAQNSQERAVDDIGFPIGRMPNAGLDDTMRSLYANMMTRAMHDNNPNRADEWYYEDPQRRVQGPFSSRDMLAWYEAGFFTPNLMVRRGCEPHMRPLGSYGPVVPFSYDLNYHNVQRSYERLAGPAQEMVDRVAIDEALWSQPGPEPADAWTQRTTEVNEFLNNFPPCFWNFTPSASSMNLPAEIVKEMKTEDEILAQLRAKSNTPAPQPTPSFLADAPVVADDKFNARSTPDLETLQRLMQGEALTSASEPKSESEDSETKSEKPDNTETRMEPIMAKTQPPSETKSIKLIKSEQDKLTKSKDGNNLTKTKNKKNKDEKKEDMEPKTRKEDVKPEKTSAESSPSKSKKEDKQSKKEQEKEKKEWLKEGFTIVKGSEKTNNKENKKNAEVTKAVEELEKKKKEQEKLVSEEEKRKKQVDAAIKKQLQKQQEQEQHQRQLSEALAKRAPWSVSSQETVVSKSGLTLSEIQRLEREKKLEQMKEQQHMMHLIAQQQAAALAREQEMQANLAWAKNNLANNGVGPTLAEIQAETRRLSAAAAVVTTQSIEEVIPLPPLNTNFVPWGNPANGGGFWDTQQSSAVPEKPQAVPPAPVKPVEPKIKKKPVPPPIPIKREASPTTEFEGWCCTALTLWRSKIDVPTFVGFLKDIESPYEVKDYVKCYLGDTKESSDFARQFLERRSKLLRVGMVTPSDDLCSPAIAINPRASLSEYQEVKSKGKKSKKNKMLKVDARILGFSVTASEDRINVGDIDTV